MTLNASPWWALLALIPVVLALPSSIAVARRLPDRRRIYALNAAGILLFSCWLAALGWAVLGRDDVSLYESLKSHGRWVMPTAIITLIALSILGLLFIPSISHTT